MVEWSCTNKKNKLMRTLIFGRIVVYKERINERIVEWSCANVECSCANERYI